MNIEALNYEYARAVRHRDAAKDALMFALNLPPEHRACFDDAAWEYLRSAAISTRIRVLELEGELLCAHGLGTAI